jgi:hypothetical protein
MDGDGRMCRNSISSARNVSRSLIFVDPALWRVPALPLAPTSPRLDRHLDPRNRRRHVLGELVHGPNSPW